MDESIVGSKEKVFGYCTGFVTMAAGSKLYQRFPFPAAHLSEIPTDDMIVFSMLYGLIGMRENASGTH